MTNFVMRHLTFSFAAIVLLLTSNVLVQDGSSSALALNLTVNMQTETNGYMLSLSFPNEF